MAPFGDAVANVLFIANVLLANTTVVNNVINKDSACNCAFFCVKGDVEGEEETVLFTNPLSKAKSIPKREAPDGCWYTRAEFAAFYGGDAEWHRCKVDGHHAAVERASELAVDTEGGGEMSEDRGDEISWQAVLRVGSEPTGSDGTSSLAVCSPKRRASDGQMYTQTEFEAHYGGVAEWEAAAASSGGEGGIDAGDEDAEGGDRVARESVPKRRASDGIMYTQADFEAHYGGLAEWEAAADLPVAESSDIDSDHDLII